MNASSVPTQDKCDEICSCIEGDVFCDKKSDCVSEDYDTDITTQESGVEEDSVTTVQPDEDVVAEETTTATTKESVEEAVADEQVVSLPSPLMLTKKTKVTKRNLIPIDDNCFAYHAGGV